MEVFRNAYDMIFLLTVLYHIGSHIFLFFMSFILCQKYFILFTSRNMGLWSGRFDEIEMYGEVLHCIFIFAWLTRGQSSFFKPNFEVSLIKWFKVLGILGVNGVFWSGKYFLVATKTFSSQIWDLSVRYLKTHHQKIRGYLDEFLEIFFLRRVEDDSWGFFQVDASRHLPGRDCTGTEPLVVAVGSTGTAPGTWGPTEEPGVAEKAGWRLRFGWLPASSAAPRRLRGARSCCAPPSSLVCCGQDGWLSWCRYCPPFYCWGSGSRN